MSEGETAGVTEGGAGEPAAATTAGILGDAQPPGGGSSQTTESQWHDGMNLSSDTVQLFEAKGWHKHENPFEQAATGYRNLERLRGVPGEQLLRIPEPGNEEQMAEWRTRLGVPEAAEGYEIPDVTVNGEAVDKGVIQGIAHEISATPDQAERLAEVVGKLLGDSISETQANAQANVAAQAADWTTAQGDKYEENMSFADKGFDILGWDDDFVNAVKMASPDGLAKAMNAAVLVGRVSSEPRRGDDGERGDDSWKYGLTKEAAKRALADDGPDLMKRARSGDKSASRRLDELNRVAYY